MSAGNGDGVLKIESRGIMRVQFGDGPVFSFDVVKVYDAWCDVERDFMDETGTVPRRNYTALNEAAVRFVAALQADGAGEKHPKANLPQINGTMAGDFLARLTERAVELQRFFVPNLPERPSSPKPSGEVIFSE